MSRARKVLAPAPQASFLPKTVDELMIRQQQNDVLRFMTCGSVDDGKSTLIGRLLWQAGRLFDDQRDTLLSDSLKHGTQGDQIDFSLLVDGLAAEREQGITIDVAYRFFTTDKRKFIVADTPGHEQYTRNMITAASTSDLAILLIDARHGALTQTRRHSYLVALMGIRHVVLAINKMDQIGFDVDAFGRILNAFRQFSEPLNFSTITAIPISALKGDNIVERSPFTPWYSGPTLLGYLETIKAMTATSARFAFPVQWVNRPDDSFRGYCGSVAEGSVAVGDEIRVALSGQVATVAGILTTDGRQAHAYAGDAITLLLDRDVDISRGDVLSSKNQPLDTTDQFEATLVWMHDDPGVTGRTYDLKLGTQWAGASITSIKYRVDVNTLAHESVRQLGLNDICVCNIATNKPIVFDHYENSRSLGGFILVDRYSNATVAAGMIRHGLRRAQNVHLQAVSINRAHREKLNGHAGKVIWFTGLSGAGKSTIANALEVELHSRGLRTYLLDGDNVRHGLNKDLGFTDADRVENIRRIAEVARLMMDAGLVVMTAFISPFHREREMARELIGKENFVEVYVDTSLDICEQRDAKGLYKKARLGQLPNMTGVGSSYEVPENPDIRLAGAHQSIEASVAQLLRIFPN